MSSPVLENLSSDYNFWSGEVYHINDKTGTLVTLSTNRIQKEVGRIELEQLKQFGQARIYVLKARQGGITTDQQARNLHCIWSKPGAVAMTMAHTREDTDRIFSITRRAIRNFPKRLLPNMGRGDTREITFPDMDSTFWTGTAGAKHVGKGITLTRFHGSEFAFWENPKAILGSITPALIPIGSVAVLETTPDQYDSEAHKFYREAKEGLNGYVAVFFPWWECDPKFYRLPLVNDEELGVLTDEEASLVEAHKLDKEQIKWRRKKVKEIGRLEFLRQYPEDDETCWLTAGNKYYDSDTLDILLRRTPTVRETAEGGRIRIYEDRKYKDPDGQVIFEEVVIGCDVAEGSTTGKTDRTTWTARSWPSWRLLSEFSSATVEPDEFSYLLYKWGMHTYGEAFLVIEKNYHGITVIRNLRDKHKYARKSIYHRTPLGMDFDVKTDYIGWATTAESKPLLLDYGRQLLGAAREKMVPNLSREALIDASAVVDGVLTGRDQFVSELLAWAGRSQMAKRKVTRQEPIHW